MSRVLISGITGQDGSYLAELALERGCDVHGLVRRTSELDRSRLRKLYLDPSIYGKRLWLHYCDLEDGTNLRRLVSKIAPDEFYHLAGQSHVGISFEIPESTCEMVAMATLRILEILRDLDSAPRFFHASSSEIFGAAESAPQDESTPYRPVNPLGCAKAFATRMVTIYRESYGMYLVNGILYNHESPRRGENFVTRKICRAAASIRLGLASELPLGDMSAARDWGYAPDYVEGMWRSLKNDDPGDYVFATGQRHTVGDVVDIAFETVGLNGADHVRRDSRFLRPSDPSRLVGNPSKAESILGWRRTVSFREMIERMTRHELELLERRGRRHGE